MENVFLTSKDSLANEQEEAREIRQEETPKSKEVLAKFHQIIRHYLQEEIDHPSDLIQSILGSYSLAAYLEHTVVTGRDDVIANLLSQCSSALQGIVQASSSTCFVHEEPATGIIQLLQMRLLHLYPKYSTQGYEALYSCPPTIYISPLCIPSLGNMICRKLGFPSSCVKVLRMTDDELPKLEKSLQEDLAAKRIPVMLIASIGSHHNGSVDNLLAISSLAQRFNMWLHLEGHLISKLSLLEQHKDAVLIADSLHLDLRLWLGIPSLPFVTLYRQCETALQRAACLTPSSCSTFTVVPLWFTIQMYQSSEIKERFRKALELSESLAKHLATVSNIQILSYAPQSSIAAADEVKDIPLEAAEESKPVAPEPSDPVIESEQEPEPTSEVDDSATEAKEEDEVVEESDETKEASEKDKTEDAEESERSAEIEKNDEANDSSDSSLAVKVADEEKEDEESDAIAKDSASETSDLDQEASNEAQPAEEPQPPHDMKSRPQALMETICPVVVFQYQPKTKEAESFPTSVVDDLNLWLAQVLERSCDVVHIDVIDVDQSGYALRFSPYDSLAFPTIDNMNQFLSVFDQQIEILNATVEHKSTLFQIVEASPELQLVELPGWAGLGGVRYLPAAWRSDVVEQLPDQGKEEINKINRQLVATLKLTDSAFSLGEGRDGLACVRFGMVVADTDVPALANLVRQSGRDIEASTQELETMAVLVRKGIEEAQAELQKETEQKLWEEGLIRHIPVVGSLVNYFLPAQKSVRIHGYVLSPDSKKSKDDELDLPVTGSSGAAHREDSEAMPILFSLKQVEASEVSKASSMPEVAESSEIKSIAVPEDSESEKAMTKSDVPDAQKVNAEQEIPIEQGREDLPGASAATSEPAQLSTLEQEVENSLIGATEQDATGGQGPTAEVSAENERGEKELHANGTSAEPNEPIPLEASAEEKVEVPTQVATDPERFAEQGDIIQISEDRESPSNEELTVEEPEMSTADVRTVHSEREVEEVNNETQVTELQVAPRPESVDESGETNSCQIPDTSCIEESLSKSQEVTRSIVEEIRKMDEKLLSQIELQLNLTAMVKKAFAELAGENAKGDKHSTGEEPKGAKSIVEEIEKIDEKLQKQIELQMNLTSLVKQAVAELKLQQSAGVASQIAEVPDEVPDKVEIAQADSEIFNAVAPESQSDVPGGEAVTLVTEPSDEAIENGTDEEPATHTDSQIADEPPTHAEVPEEIRDSNEPESAGECNSTEVSSDVPEVNDHVAENPPIALADADLKQEIPAASCDVQVCSTGASQETEIVEEDPSVESPTKSEVPEQEAANGPMETLEVAEAASAADELAVPEIPQSASEVVEELVAATEEVAAGESVQNDSQHPAESVETTQAGAPESVPEDQSEPQPAPEVPTEDSVAPDSVPVDQNDSQSTADVAEELATAVKAPEDLAPPELVPEDQCVPEPEVVEMAPPASVPEDQSVSQHTPEVVVEPTAEVKAAEELAFPESTAEGSRVSQPEVAELAEMAEAPTGVVPPESVAEDQSNPQLAPEVAEELPTEVKADEEFAAPESVPVEDQIVSQSAPEVVESTETLKSSEDLVTSECVAEDSETTAEVAEEPIVAAKASEDLATPESVPDGQNESQLLTDEAQAPSDDLTTSESVPDDLNGSETAADAVEEPVAAATVIEDLASPPSNPEVQVELQTVSDAAEVLESVPDDPKDSQPTEELAAATGSNDEPVVQETEQQDANESVIEADLSDLAQMSKPVETEVEPPIDLNGMAQLVQQGIKEAQAELQREIEEHVWQEGLMRHLPVVGSLYNFFSPPPKADIKGRTLNLQKGRVEKSEIPAATPAESSSNA